MTGLPGRQIASFTAGELEELLWYRDDLKYRHAGLSLARNIEIAPQGGFRQAGGTDYLGQVIDTAEKILAFRNSAGGVYDITLSNGLFEAWQGTEKKFSGAQPLSAAQVREMSWKQRDDTAILFHEDVETPRIKQVGDTDWQVDKVPYENIPTFDYGGPIGGGSYTNGVAAVWDLDFINFKEEGSLTLAEIAYTLTVSGQTTPALLIEVVGGSPNEMDEDAMAISLQAAILDLSGVEAGVTVAKLDERALRITFAGEGNLGDQWAVSGEVVNRATAAVVSYKSTIGVEPGEPIISADRGWPSCGDFYQQRFIVGGFKSRPGDWMASITGDLFDFDTRIKTADGPFVVPMEVQGGERLLEIAATRNLVLLTDEAEYWLAERKLSKTEAPVHVQASRNGVKRGVSTVENEGALVYVHETGDVISEFRFTDVDGNFISQSISVLATHLVDDVIDLAQRKAEGTREGNQLAVVQGDGSMRLVTLLRQQEVTAFTRYETDGTFKAVCVDGNNDMIALVSRTSDVSIVNRERFNAERLLHCTITGTNDPAGKTISGLGPHEGQSVWCIANGDVLGPFTVSGGSIELQVEVTDWEVGRWTAPRAVTLPLTREIGPQIVKQTSLRIATVKMYVIDTTSIAISLPGGKVYDIDLQRYGHVVDGGELDQGFTGWVEKNLPPNTDPVPRVEITQKRPGRMLVAALILEADT